MVPPAISVLVTAHHRAEFLRAAVDSVLGQELPRAHYEVIVVKNFDHPEIDRYLSDRGVLNCRTDAGSLGAKLEVGLQVASGPVIAFLEDDDVFQPDRLALLERAFEDPEMGYFHNAVQVLGRDGRPGPGRFHEECLTPAMLPARDRTPRSVRAFLGVGPSFNLSSTALRREALEPARPYLSRTNLTCDNLLCYAALVAPFRLENSGDRLTGYRLHASASWSPSGPEAFWSAEAAKWKAVVDGFELISEMARGHPVERFVACDLRLRRAMYALATDSATAPFSPRDLLNLIACRLFRGEGISVGLASAGLLLRAFAPPVERRLYGQYIRRQTQALGIG